MTFKRFMLFLSPVVAIALVASLMISTPLSVIAQEDDNDDNQNQDNQQSVSVADILDNPNQYAGDRVTVTGTVAELTSPRVFSLEGESGSETLPVAAPPDVVPADLGQGSTVEVTGFVQDFNPRLWTEEGATSGTPTSTQEADSTEEMDATATSTSDDTDENNEDDGTPTPVNDDALDVTATATNSEDATPTNDDSTNQNDDDDSFGIENWFNGEDAGVDPSSSIYAGYHDGPIIAAFEVRMTDGQSDTSNGSETSLSDIFDDPDELVGTQVTVKAQVTDVINNQALVLSHYDIDNDLPVLGDTNAFPSQMINEDAIARASGTIQMFDSSDPESWGGEDLNLDFSDDMWSDYDGEPVLVASNVERLVPAKGAMTEQILDDNDEWIDEDVTLFNTVADVMNDSAFTVDGTEGFLGITSTDLLVVGASDVMPSSDLTADALVRVEGTVHRFNSDDLNEDELGIDLNDDVFNDFDEDDPVVVADSVTILASNRGQTVEEILDETDSFVGQDVTVAGGVTETLNNQAFNLEGTDGFLGLTGGDDLLVIAPEGVIPADQITDDVVVVASGTVQRFNADDLDEQELGIDLNDDVFDDVDEDDPVLVADSVTPLVAD